MGLAHLPITAVTKSGEKFAAEVLGVVSPRSEALGQTAVGKPQTESVGQTAGEQWWARGPEVPPICEGLYPVTNPASPTDGSTARLVEPLSHCAIDQLSCTLCFQQHIPTCWSTALPRGK